jgi:hypothetical protein
MAGTGTAQDLTLGPGSTTPGLLILETGVASSGAGPASHVGHFSVCSPGVWLSSVLARSLMVSP